MELHQNSYSMILVLCILYIVTFSDGYKILVVFPHPGRSHFFIYEPLLTSLASRGHNLTVISYHPRKEPIPNYRDVSLSENKEREKGPEFLSMANLSSSRFNSFKGFFLLGKYTEKSCRDGLQNGNFRRFLSEKNDFDLILLQYFISECFMGLSKIYNAPIIGMSTNQMMPWFSQWFGNPDNPAYIPNMHLRFSQKMDFLERVENTACNLYYTIGYNFFLGRSANEYSKQYLNIDLLEEASVFYNASLLFTPTHFSIHGAVPLVPNIIEIGGLHVGTPKKLSKFLERYVNESSEGVIYFSMGSTLKGYTFPEEKRLAFLKNFGRLPQRVIWKWENDTMKEKTDNVLLQRWTPQLDLICHPNVKAFVYHGGLLSTLEAVHCGVPLIVVPQFADQFRNAKALEVIGVAVVLRMNDISEENVAEALKKALSTDFRTKAQEVSKRFKDRPLPPLETAVYWVEYVAKHKGAPFMRTAAVDMPLYQYFLIDVFAFLIILLVLLCYVSYLFFKLVFRLCSCFLTIKYKRKLD